MPYEKKYLSESDRDDQYILILASGVLNMNIKKLLGGLVNPLSTMDVYIRPSRENRPLDKMIKIITFPLKLWRNGYDFRVQH